MLARFERVLQDLGQLRRRIKRRVLIVVPVFFAGFGTTWYFSADLFAFLLVPAGGALSPFDGLPVYTKPTGMMSATFGLAWKGGAIIAFP